MPPARRDLRISLTITQKKGKALKERMVNEIRSCVDQYDRVLLFNVLNMRNNKFQNLREEWKSDSRFMFGKNRILTMGMGLTRKTEVAVGIRKLARAMKGQCGLLFTNKPEAQMVKWMTDFVRKEYAKAGFIPSETIVLPAGPLHWFPHAIEPYFRQLGMPVSLRKGAIVLLKDFELCKTGTPLTPEQAQILKHFDKRLADFKLVPIGVYSKKDGYKSLRKGEKEENPKQEVMETETIN